jgi:hypothetical protein
MLLRLQLYWFNLFIDLHAVALNFVHINWGMASFRHNGTLRGAYNAASPAERRSVVIRPAGCLLLRS